MKTIPAGDFKTHCLALMDEVNETREPMLITKRGKPVAKLVPVEAEADDGIFGFWKGKIHIGGDIVSPTIPEDEWESLR